MIKLLNYLLVFLLLTAILGCSDESENHPNPVPAKINTPVAPIVTPEVIPEKKPVLPVKNPIFDATARYISGLSQVDANAMSELEKFDFWQEYRANFDENWQLMTKERLDKMSNWQQTEFASQRDGQLPLFYPFSGPDFIHAYYLYPETNYYLFLAKEKVGEIPDLTGMDEKQLHAYLSDVHHALRDIYLRSYFITGHMGQDLSKYKLNGVFPLFYVFLARSHHEILQVHKLAMDEKGVIREYTDENRNELNKYDIQGVKFIFKPYESENVKTLVYFDMDISDEGFAKNPAALLYIKSLGKVNTYVKSASYLMHYRTFNQIREAVLAMSESVFEDDTGIPYKYFDPKVWQVQLFGNYTKPIKDFKGVDQPELKIAYQNKAAIKELPFSTGYHWATDDQNHLLAIRITP